LNWTITHKTREKEGLECNPFQDLFYKPSQTNQILEIHGNPAFNTHPVSSAATPLFRGESWKSPLSRGDLGVCLLF